MKINLLTLNSVEKTEISEKKEKNFSGEITGLKLPKSFGDAAVTLTIAVDVQDKEDYKVFQAAFGPAVEDLANDVAEETVTVLDELIQAKLEGGW